MISQKLEIVKRRISRPPWYTAALSLPVGKLRIRKSGSAGGHNGLKNIIQHLGTDAFPRINSSVARATQRATAIGSVFVGMVVFLSISLVATPPMVSMDRDSGVTSRRRISPAPASPASLPPWMEAP